MSGAADATAFDIGGQKILGISTGWGGEGLYVYTQGALPAAADCGSGNNFKLANDHPMQREMILILLVAIQNKAPVSLYVDGCVGGSMVLRAVSLTAS